MRIDIPVAFMLVPLYHWCTYDLSDAVVFPTGLFCMHEDGMKRSFKATIVFILLSLLTLFPNISKADADATTFTLADFEGGLDSRGVTDTALGGDLRTTLSWTREDPESLASDGINYFDVFADDDDDDEFVDYQMNLSPQNWDSFTTLAVRLRVSCDDGCMTNPGVQFFIHSTDSITTTDNITTTMDNGYHNLGTYYPGQSKTTLSLDIGSAPNRDQIDQVMVRVRESYFSDGPSDTAYERVELFDMSLIGNITVPKTVSSAQFGTVVSKGAWDYGPSVIQDGDIYRMYWCSSDGYGDSIWYATSVDGLNWTDEHSIISPTPNSLETKGNPDGHTCDPSIVKVNNIYYLYYTATAANGSQSSVNNQIFLATSHDGITWTKYPDNTNPKPVISNTINSGKYGVGQSTVMYINGKFWQFYTNTDRGGTMLAISYDGITWRNQNCSFICYPVVNSFNFVPTYLTKYNVFFAAVACCEDHNGGIYYFFSKDGYNWQPSHLGDNSMLLPPVGGNRTAAHNGGFLTNPLGLNSTNQLKFYYGAGTPNALSWDIDLTNITVDP